LFTGALPYLMGETLAIWLVAFFLTQNYPRSSAYWVLSIGLGFVSLFSALAFLFVASSSLPLCWSSGDQCISRKDG